MKAVIQRVSSAQCVVEGNVTGKIEKGFLVLLGVGQGDTEREAEAMANKVASLRIFCDENDKMNLSLLDVGGDALVISNFTLYADTHKGRRPNFFAAAQPAEADRLYMFFCRKLSECGIEHVERGIFGASMKVSLCNEGPVTIILDTKEFMR